MREKSSKISRREFAQQAMALSATASLVPAASVLELPVRAHVAGQEPPNLPKLGPASQAESDARFQQIISLHGSQFDDGQKALIKTLCVFLQPALDHVRAYPVNNGDSPALYLKPLVEREKKPQAAHAVGASAPNS
jgi:hypothetical protein